ncbi:MAG TPA: phosphoribosylanthranilate isomerase, partial [Roseiarcus sp.]|nr:phosphoribosylanthranilate isomerase [Roseiarcus sp.]
SVSLEAALAAGADMVGFVFFAKSPRHVSLDEARQLGAIARGRAKIAALSVDADDAALKEIVEALAPDFLQLHGRETPERVAMIGNNFGVATIKAIGVEGPTDLVTAKSYAGAADMLLYDAKARKDARLPGGNGVPFDWRLLDGVAGKPAYLLSGGLDAGNVAEAIRLSGASGVDVSSGVERAPGVKDNAKIAAFIANARAAFAVIKEEKSARREIAGRVA